MMPAKRSGQKLTYQIRVRETLDGSITNWLPSLTVIPQENGETVLAGQFVDQAALRGLLDELWNLNLTVLSVEASQERQDRDIGNSG
jgi:hypothetical protein